ncbi:hypothetical protein MYXO_00120 [Myxococcaceae bacterium]|jgi:hypothetical protein|nr:hypothetical protein MYXO_00120 [Myxococcaceae bacterium]
MLKTTRIAAVAVSLLVAASWLAPGIASAQLRDFEGEVSSINESKIIVDNKKGDKITFEKTGETTVEGKVTAWDAVKKGDWVAVASKMLEKPRKAYKVVVKDKPADAAVDD